MNPFRVATIHEYRFRNDGAPLYLKEAFKKIPEAEIHHYLPHGNPALWGAYDLFLWVDFAEDALLSGHDFVCPKPNFYWVSDYHIEQKSYDYRLKKAREFDWIGCYQKGNVEAFAKDGIDPKRLLWLPPAAEPTCYRPGLFLPDRGWVDCEVKKEYDLSFVGHVNGPKRVGFLAAMYQAFQDRPFFWGVRFFEECSNIYNKSKVVMNVAYSTDINMRVFEVMASGAFLLTEAVPHLDELFEDGVHLATWKTVEEAIEKARYYADHNAERERIAQRGREEVLAKHTYLHRARTILETVKQKESTHA